MDGLDGTSFNNGSSTVNLGSDLGPLGGDASSSAQASWDRAAADAGLGEDDSADDMGWGGAGGSVPTITVRPSATSDGPDAPDGPPTGAGGDTAATPATAGADTGKSFWQEMGDFLTDPHTALGAASFAPSVFGSAASAADGLLYAAQGKYTDAGLSLGAAAVGVVSDAGAARLAAKGIKAGAEALTAGMLERLSSMPSRLSASVERAAQLRTRLKERRRLVRKFKPRARRLARLSRRLAKPFRTEHYRVANMARRYPTQKRRELRIRNSVGRRDDVAHILRGESLTRTENL